MDNRARATDAPRLLALAFDRSVTGIVRTYVPDDVPAESAAAIPLALDAGILQPLIESMLRRSPTFRRQCERLASPRLGGISVRYEPLTGVRAITEISPVNGRLNAVVRLGIGDNDVELIAHEIEHIIEQLDGVDLRARSELSDTGVHSCTTSRASFETVRATRAGLKVAQEFRQNGG
jgi:hypothetical protein